MKYLLILVFASTVALAQKKKNQPAPAEEAKPTGIAAKTASMQKFAGYFDFYFDEKQDKVFLRIDKFDQEFLYVNSLPAGIGSNDIGLDRGQLGSERVVKFDRRGPKVLLIEPNYRYRAVSSNADERRAVEEAFAQSVLWGFKVEAEEGGSVLVDASDFYLQDAHDVIGRLRGSQQGSYSLDKSRSAFYLPRTKNFPKNTEVEVTLTFTGQPAGGFIRSVVPTPTSVTVRQHHSFVELPDSDYTPREFDPRAGYFSMLYYDYATPINVPLEKRFITRHRLKKKDPAAAVSEPVEPIIYYMDRGAPEPIRSALMEGARWWNQAFEAAGYKDAFRVELLPEDADPMDVRYNLIQWVHRSTRGWSYGASVSDPRTGEIIKGHVTLGSLRVRQDFLIAQGLLAPYEDGKPVSKEMETMALARLRQLAAHEVGHTLGLAHSYASSTEKLASVMDYPHPIVNIANGKLDLSNAYDTNIGEWDKVAITYGYQDFPKGADESGALNTIIQESLQAGLTFLSDQDARPFGGAHPYAHLWDNGKVAADELDHVLQVRALALKNFGERNIPGGAPMATLEEVLVPVYFFHRYQTVATAKSVGGLLYRYALRGDGQPVAELLSPAAQLKALESLLKTVAPEALALPENVIRTIPPHPMGYGRGREVMRVRTDLTFDPLGAAEGAADFTFSLLLQPGRATRVVEHHARDKAQPSLALVIDKVFDATFKAPAKEGYLGLVQRTVDYACLENLLALGADDDASMPVKEIVNFKVTQLRKVIEDKLKVTTSDEWKAHYAYLLNRVAAYNDEPGEFKKTSLLAPPPGEPIGTLEEFCEQD